MVRLTRWLVVTVGLLGTASASAHDCANGASVSEDRLAYICDLFAKGGYVPPGSRDVDPRISNRLPPAGPYDPPIRSFAVVVSIATYPQATKQDDKNLAAVEIDRKRIIDFLKSQLFDEIIVLNDDVVTPEHIDDILRSYIYPLVKGPYKGRARFFFSYDGHGAYGDDPTLSGGLALSTSLGENDSAPTHAYPLSELRDRLEAIATFAYQSVALLGSCYSGSIFPLTALTSTYDSNSAAPGAHVVAAASKAERAWTGPPGHGTVFFDEIMDAVENAQPVPDNISLSTVSDATGRSYPFSKQIVRLANVVLSVNADQEDKLNPVTHQKYPFLRTGQMAPNKGYEGTFFFLGNAAPAQTWTFADSPVTGSEAQTGSAVIGRPDLKVFNPPEFYKIRGVDLSRYNRDVDFAALSKADIRFAYLKATESAKMSDLAYAHRYDQARQAGLAVGAYHVFSFCADADQQFRNVQEHAKIDPNDLPLVIDLEWFGRSALPGEEGCMDMATIRASLRRFADQVADWSKKKPMLYGPTDAIKTVVGDGFNDLPLWIAKWQRGPGGLGPSFGGTNPWTMWQYTGSGHVDGIKGEVDLSLFFGSEQHFEQFRSGGGNVALAAATGGK